MATYEENVLKKVLIGIEHDDKFSLDTPRAILARHAAKFILDMQKGLLYTAFVKSSLMLFKT